MSTQLNKRYVLLLLITIIGMIFLFVFVIQSRFNKQIPYYPSEYKTSGSYKINPYTVIESLDNGNKNVFMLVRADGSPDNLLTPGSISWTQSDYLKIARALFEFLWKESLDDWIVFSLEFDKDCRNSIGFDMADIALYKTFKGEYTLRRVVIYPLAGEVDWGGDTTIPRPFLNEWHGVDLNNFGITADDALRIAEEYGKKEHFIVDGDDCRIYVSIPGVKEDERWKVSYYHTPSFDLLIDPFSGKYEVLK